MGWGRGGLGLEESLSLHDLVRNLVSQMPCVLRLLLELEGTLPPARRRAREHLCWSAPSELQSCRQIILLLLPAHRRNIRRRTLAFALGRMDLICCLASGRGEDGWWELGPSGLTDPWHGDATVRRSTRHNITRTLTRWRIDAAARAAAALEGCRVEVRTVGVGEGLPDPPRLVAADPTQRMPHHRLGGGDHGNA